MPVRSGFVPDRATGSARRASNVGITKDRPIAARPIDAFKQLDVENGPLPTELAVLSPGTPPERGRVEGLLTRYASDVP